MRIRTLLSLTVLAVAVAAPSSCVRQPEQTTYFQRVVQPILQTSCARGPTGAGCHVADDKGNAFGNLDVTTYASVNRRRDLLVTYGPYGQPAMLAKVIPPFQVPLTAYDGQTTTVTTDIRHAGGPILDPTSTAYLTLRRWIDDGATENNAPPPSIADSAGGGCTTEIRAEQGFDPSTDPMRSDYSVFKDKANSVLKDRCASTHCHGAAGNQLQLTCGDSDEQKRWNYYAAAKYIGPTSESSELVRRPLDPSQGGSFHEGGVVFKNAQDSGYQALRAWLDAHGPGDTGNLTPAYQFFAHRVQPVLVRKGCMLMQCHSGISFHDYRPRGGSAGAFSLSSTNENYKMATAQVAFESDDPRASRIVRKNLYRPEAMANATGIVHRGGSLLEDFGATPADLMSCAGPYDYDGGDLDKIPAYCMIGEWIARERTARKYAPLSAIVYVKRPIPTSDRYQDFDVYSPGADLRIVQVTMSQAGLVTPSGDASVAAGCGLTVATADIRRPSVSWDGTKVAFAARSSDQEPLRVYEMNADGSGCALHAPINAGPATENGLLVHNFDPAYSPPDATSGGVHLVFASTRGNLDPSPYDYQGAQRTPADPSKPNANLWSYEPDPKNKGMSRVVQLTFLLNMERGVSFMQDGRLIFTTEKRQPGFYQLALRRMNIDGGDYHPLYGQRGSIGYDEATQVVHLADKNFAAVFATHGVPHHGGTLITFNRSIGVDFTSPRPQDYPVDPGVIDPNAPNSPEPNFFLRSLRILDPSASGKPGTPTTGLYSAPSALPNDKLVVSWGAASDPASFNGDYDLYVMDGVTGAKMKLLGDPGTAEVDAVGIYARTPRTVYRSNPGEPNAYQMDESRKNADVLIHDAPLILSLAFQNTPTGRPTEPLTFFEIYESLPPPLSLTSLDGGDPFIAKDDWGKVYAKRRLVGKVPIQSDGSARYSVPGGLPILMHLPDTADSMKGNYPRWQREEMMFSPGESVHEAFPQPLFDAFCGGCHGSRSGRPVDFAQRPDLLVGASKTVARDMTPTDLTAGPGSRGQPVGP